MEAPSVLAALLGHGLPGIVIALLAVWIWRQDKAIKDARAELNAEKDARIEDAQNYTTMALKAQETIISSVNKLSDVFEAMQKMQQDPRRRLP